MKHIFHKIKYGALIFLIVFGTQISRPPQAHALYSLVTDLVTNIETALIAVYDAYVKVQAQYLQLKETVLDPLAWALAKSIIQSMTGSIVNWINSGFQGSPAFLSNPEGFFTNVGDQITGQFISKTGILSGLCSPFSVDIRLSLALQQAGYTQAGKYTCTLGSIINNVQNTSVSVNGRSIKGFLSGDYTQGGMAAFIAAGEPQNNPGMVYLQAQSDLNQQIANKQNQYQQQLLQGNGFLSFEDCKDITLSIAGGGVTTPQYLDSLGLSSAQQATLNKNVVGTYNTGNGTSIRQTANATGEHYQQCKTTTPGSVISSSLSKALGAGQDSLVAADEIDEVITALLGQLMNQVLTGGLSTVSQPSSHNAQSYINSMLNSTTAGNNPSLNQNTLSVIDEYLKNAQDYNAVYNSDVADIQAVANLYQNALIVCTSTPNMVLQIQSVIDTEITPLLNTYQGKYTATLTGINNLQGMRDGITSATSTQAVNAATQQFTAYFNGGSNVIKLTDVQDAKNDVKDLEKKLTLLKNKVQTYLLQCGSGGTSHF